jgi:pectate lyase
MISVGSNKTIIGRKGASISNLQRNEKAGIFLLEGSRNIIIRNLTLLGPGALDIDANNSDNISLVGAVKVWVDHCDIQDGIDGNMDIVNGSDSICVSWTRFRYLIPPMASGSGGNNDHRNSNLIGNSNKNVEQDAGRLNCTFINCWWGEGCSERCPRVRFGKVHVVNSLYNGNDFTYCIGYGVYSNIYAEKCAFTTKNAQDNYLYDWHGDADFNVKVTGCLGVDDVELKQGNQ